MQGHEFSFLVRVEADAEAGRRHPRVPQYRRTDSYPRVEVPAELAAWHHRFFGDAARTWIAALPDLADELLDRWRLRLDGTPVCGAVALVVPVRQDDDAPAALKLQPVDEETHGEPIALRTWNGKGAVRLLKHDRTSGSMLLERLDSRTLASVHDDLEALEVIAGMLARFSTVRAPRGLRQLGNVANEMLDRVPHALALVSDPTDRQLFARCADAVRELLPETGDRLLHGDLHFHNVLASHPSDPREPWLAIDPKPLAGDPGFELLAALHNRWDDVIETGNIPRAVRRRFDLMTATVGLERERAIGWTLGRVLQNALWDIENATTSWNTEPDKAIARTLLDR